MTRRAIRPISPDSVQLRCGKILAGRGTQPPSFNRFARWLPENPTKPSPSCCRSTAAARTWCSALRKAGIDYVENLRSTTGTRAVVGALAMHAGLSARPQRQPPPWRMSTAFGGATNAARKKPSAVSSTVAAEIRKIPNIEDFLWPRTTDWLDEKVSAFEQANLHEHLLTFRALVRRWLSAADLPIDQLILTLSGDLFTLEAEIATAYSCRPLSPPFCRTPPGSPSAGIHRRTPRHRAVASATSTGVGDDDDAFDPDATRE